MKFHVAIQGETLSSIYNKYYGRPDLSSRWDEGLAYFVTFNIMLATIRPYKLLGGELVLLPDDSLPLDLSTRPISLKDVGV